MYLPNACNKAKTVNYIRQQYLHVFYYKSHLIKPVCKSLDNPLQTLFQKTMPDGFEDTRCALLRPIYHTAISWKMTISDYAAHGKGKEALECYKCMLHAGFEPDASVYVSLLKACSDTSDIEAGKHLHAELIEKGFTSDLFVCHTLVNMYGKCWSVVDAESVFGGLPYRNVVSWNVMLGAYVHTENGKKALLLYRQMQEEGKHPNERTFVSVLRACCSNAESAVDGDDVSRSACLEIGQTLHAFAWKTGFAKDTFIGCTLMCMYGKCGSLPQAETVFDKLSHNNVITWNALLSAYIHRGEVQRALLVYRQMLKDGVRANERTFVVILQACFLDEAIVEDEQMQSSHLELGQALHADVRKQGYASDVFVGSTLVSLYGKYGRTVEAESAFQDISNPNVLSWNAMLFAYVEQGEEKKALQLYRQMEEDGVYPNERTFEVAVRACYLDDSGAVAQLDYLEIGQGLHAVVRRRQLISDFSIGSSLISMYARLKGIEHAENVFVGMSEYDVFPWTAMLSTYVEQGKGEKALQLYSRMQKETAVLDHQIFVCILQACCLLAEKEEAAVIEGQSIKQKSLEVGRAIHNDAQIEGFVSHVYVCSTLVTMYGKCGSIREAEEVLYGFSSCNIVPWNAMLSAYLLHGRGERALLLYEKMLKKNMTLDEVTVMCVLQACIDSGNVEVCRHTHFALIFETLNLSLLVGNVLVRAYTMCASMLDAWSVLNGLIQADVVSWSALLHGYARQGHCRECHEAFKQMQHIGFEPDAVTLLSLLLACNHEGLVNEGIGGFISMYTDYSITPMAKHYVTILDLLGRAGDLARVQHTLSHMPMQPNVATWMGLLGSCRTHGNLELGKQLFSEVVQLWPNEASAYVLMSNLCGDVDQV